MGCHRCHPAGDVGVVSPCWGPVLSHWWRQGTLWWGRGVVSPRWGRVAPPLPPDTPLGTLGLSPLRQCAAGGAVSPYGGDRGRPGGAVIRWWGQGGVTALGTGGCHPWGGVQQAVTARVTPTGTHGGPRAPHCACARRAQQTARAHTPRPHGPRTAHARSIASGPARMRTHSPAAPHACAFAPPAPPVAAHMRSSSRPHRPHACAVPLPPEGQRVRSTAAATPTLTSPNPGRSPGSGAAQGRAEGGSAGRTGCRPGPGGAASPRSASWRPLRCRRRPAALT